MESNEYVTLSYLINLFVSILLHIVYFNIYIIELITPFISHPSVADVTITPFRIRSMGV
jgi:hypothetical protein